MIPFLHCLVLSRKLKAQLLIYNTNALIIITGDKLTLYNIKVETSVFYCTSIKKETTSFVILSIWTFYFTSHTIWIHLYQSKEWMAKHSRIEIYLTPPAREDEVRVYIFLAKPLSSIQPKWTILVIDPSLCCVCQNHVSMVNFFELKKAWKLS